MPVSNSCIIPCLSCAVFSRFFMQEFFLLYRDAHAADRIDPPCGVVPLVLRMEFVSSHQGRMLGGAHD